MTEPKDVNEVAPVEPAAVGAPAMTAEQRRASVIANVIHATFNAYGTVQCVTAFRDGDALHVSVTDLCADGTWVSTGIKSTAVGCSDAAARSDATEQREVPST